MENWICSHFTAFSIWGLGFVKLQVAFLVQELHTCKRPRTELPSYLFTEGSLDSYFSM